MTSKSVDREAPPQGVLVIHPERDGRDSSRSAEARLEEAIGLSLALDLETRDAIIVPLRKRTPATLFGSGKVLEIAALCESLEADVVVVDDALTPVQQRNLEKAWQVKVIDRTGLILEIFARRARTREGRLQVELARLSYEKSRLVRTWTHLERQRGGFGVMGGPGETQIETDRRLLAEKIGKLKKELVEVRRTRNLQRGARQRHPFPSVALVGYTNAGKSTLFNRLTNADVVAQDMLFATLDPTLRMLDLPDGRPAILSDTVGFISDLPHELVESFRATLEEVKEADVILHVRDIATAESAAQAQDVRTVLERLGITVADRNVIEVWNKADLVDEELRDDLAGDARRQKPPAVLLSAVTGDGCEALLGTIAALVDDAEPVEIQTTEGAAIAWLYRNGRVMGRHDDDHGGVRLSVRLSPQALGQFEQLFPKAELRY
ncbi:GTPase HflX [Phenylobacterium sp.]|uniref:GTPase HflX n=1 Tax=Phenylobacterium sp. TaxID=1871053 RepID=UPI002737053E|nr:GTPase HflX [Phenylobacterium sp.]MDP3855711.1 GTPase HflX [Phenylobacterium sp.]